MFKFSCFAQVSFLIAWDNMSILSTDHSKSWRDYCLWLFHRVTCPWSSSFSWVINWNTYLLALLSTVHPRIHKRADWRLMSKAYYEMARWCCPFNSTIVCNHAYCFLWCASIHPWMMDDKSTMREERTLFGLTRPPNIALFHSMGPYHTQITSVKLLRIMNSAHVTTARTWHSCKKRHNMHFVWSNYFKYLFDCSWARSQDGLFIRGTNVDSYNYLLVIVAIAGHHKFSTGIPFTDHRTS